MVVLRPLFVAALVVCRRYFIVAPRKFPAAPLVVRRRCLIVVPMPAAPRMYLAVSYRPLPAAPLVVRCVRGANTFACGRSGASQCRRRQLHQLTYACGTKSWRGAQVDARGTTQVLDRGEQAVARGAARCLLHVLGRSATSDACGRSLTLL